MTALTSAENYAVALEILAETSIAIGEGARPEVIDRDIARAQVYATLATVQPRPSEQAIAEAIDGAMYATLGDPWHTTLDRAVKAVGRLL